MQRAQMSASKGALWLAASRIVMIFCSIVSTMALARLLSPHEFGLAAPATVILALSFALFDGALGVSVVRRAEVSVLELEELLGAAIMSGFALAAILALASPVIADLVNLPEATHLIAGSTLVIWVRSVYVVLAAYHQRSRQFDRLAVGAVGSSFVGSIVVSVALAWLGFGAWALTIGAIWGALSEAVILYTTAPTRLRPRFSLAAFRRLGKDEGAFMLTSLTNWAALSSPTLIAASLLGASQAGIYTRSQRILEIVVSVVAGPLQRVLLPKFSGEASDSERLKKSFTQTLEVILLLSTTFGVMGVLHAHTIITILLGEQWLEAVPVVQALMIVLTARCAYKVTEAASIALGPVRAVLGRQLLYLVLSVGAGWFGSGYGAAGVATGTSFAIVGFYLASLTYAVLLLEVSYRAVFMAHLRSLVCGLILVGVHVALSSLDLSGPAYVIDGLRGLTEGLVLLLVLAFSPFRLIGPALSIMRNRALKMVARR